jgi:oligopeptide/dipeptide ABC transporter ATP-binding protein
MSNPPLLEIDALSIVLRSRREPIPIVREVSIQAERGETICIVGETGSGKSVTMLAVMGLLPSPPMAVAGGAVRLDGRDLLQLTEREYRRVRGQEIAMVYQSPLSSLNPVMRIGDQVGEALRSHGVDRATARSRALELLRLVGIPDPSRNARGYPHEFSGGMRQRTMIAIALALSPRLLIADEPTTALDATIQQQILGLVRELQERNGMTVVWITHDLGVVARIAERVVVMYAGRVVEHGSVLRIFQAPAHPYTRGLLASLPQRRGVARQPLIQIPGSPPQAGSLPSGCPFAPRCPLAADLCREQEPQLEAHNGDGAAACWFPADGAPA